MPSLNRKIYNLREALATSDYNMVLEAVEKDSLYRGDIEGLISFLQTNPARNEHEVDVRTAIAEIILDKYQAILTPDEYYFFTTGSERYGK